MTGGGEWALSCRSCALCVACAWSGLGSWTHKAIPDDDGDGDERLVLVLLLGLLGGRGAVARRRGHRRAVGRYARTAGGGGGGAGGGERLRVALIRVLLRGAVRVLGVGGVVVGGVVVVGDVVEAGVAASFGETLELEHLLGRRERERAHVGGGGGAGGRAGRDGARGGRAGVRAFVGADGGVLLRAVCACHFPRDDEDAAPEHEHNDKRAPEGGDGREDLVLDVVRVRAHAAIPVALRDLLGPRPRQVHRGAHDRRQHPHDGDHPEHQQLRALRRVLKRARDYQEAVDGDGVQVQDARRAQHHVEEQVYAAHGLAQVPVRRDRLVRRERLHRQRDQLVAHRQREEQQVRRLPQLLHEKQRENHEDVAAHRPGGDGRHHQPVDHLLRDRRHERRLRRRRWRARARAPGRVRQPERRRLLPPEPLVGPLAAAAARERRASAVARVRRLREHRDVHRHHRDQLLLDERCCCCC